MMRPLPPPPTPTFQLPKFSGSSPTIWPQERSTPSSTHSHILRLPIGANLSTSGPRPLKARRREGRLFAHSPSSSVSSLESSSSCSITSADFWTPLEDTTPPSSDDEMPATPDTPTLTLPLPDTTSTPTPKTKLKTKTKPANIMIPLNTSSATVTSPTSVAVLRSPLSSLSTLSPLPNRRIVTPNTRIRKLAKLTRTLGENIPMDLVFPPGKDDVASPSVASPSSPASPLQFAKPAAASRISPIGPRMRLTRSPAQKTSAASSTPVPTTTAVGLHYALGMHTVPTPRAAATTAVPAPAPSSPPPFTHVFTLDTSSWERARKAAFAPRVKGSKAKRAAVVSKAPQDNGRGTWRKKEQTWSGEWNVEDMAELQVRLRQLRR